MSIQSVKFYLYGPSSPDQQFYPTIVLKALLFRLSAMSAHLCQITSQWIGPWSYIVMLIVRPASFSKVASGPKVLRMDSETLSTNV